MAHYVLLEIISSKWICLLFFKIVSNPFPTHKKQLSIDTIWPWISDNYILFWEFNLVSLNYNFKYHILI